MNDGTFCFNGNVFNYISARYQNTRLNERAVELPVALSLYNKAMCPIEVGAVLPHYLPSWPDNRHEVIDLYEQFPAVINADVLTYRPKSKHDLVLCISTLDHLNSADEVITAVENMKSWTAKDGLLFATVPAMQPPEVGGGPWLDELVLSGALDMTVYRMDKTNPAAQGWEQTGKGLPVLPYNGRTSFANTVYLMEWRCD